MEDLGLTLGLLAFRGSVIGLMFLVTSISSSATKVSTIDREVWSVLALSAPLFANKTTPHIPTRVHGYGREGGEGVGGCAIFGSLHEYTAQSVPLVALYNQVSERKVLETVSHIVKAG
jgi:hypothetical protein